MTEARGHCTALGREILRCRTAGDEAALSARELPAVQGAVLVPGAGRSAAEGADELSPRRMGRKAQEKIKLAFCSQLLCVVPYEFTRAGGFFEAEGLDVELVYTRGGNAAMQALVGGAVDYAATSFDVAVQAFANGADIRRFATTGRLPLFALAVAPGAVDAITSLKDLEGKTVGVSALGNADHTLLLYLLARPAPIPSRSAFAALGPEPVRGAAPRSGRRGHGAGARAHADRRGRRQGAVQRHGHRRLRRGSSAAPTSSWASPTGPRSATSGWTQMQPLAAGARARAACAARPRRSRRFAVAAGGAPRRRRRRALRRDHRAATARRSTPKSVAIDVEACAARRQLARDRRRADQPTSISACCSTPRSCRRDRASPGRARSNPSAAPARRPAARAAHAPVVRVRDLRMRYGAPSRWSTGVSLAVGRGPVRQPVGPSGSGKSTVLRAITGLHRPDGGTVDLGSTGARPGFLFQDDALLPWRTARQNVALGLRSTARAPAEALAEADRLARAARARRLRGPLSAAALRRPAQARGPRAGAGAAAEAAADGRALRLARRDRAPPRHPGSSRLGGARGHRRAARHPRPRGGAGAVRRGLPAVARAARARSATAIRSRSRGRAT